MVTISFVIPRSPAYKAGIKQGDCLQSINGNDINDVLDYKFYSTEENLELLVFSDDKLCTFYIEKDEYDELGLDFETYLIDKERRCSNSCIFCFIDQMPKGCRETLYFKDDDSRLSFLTGNYITATNLNDSDLDRIIKMKLSPLNLSVHTMNPDLRVKIMGNPHAANIANIISKLVDGGIHINCQLVLCKNINDGGELDYSLNELERFYPYIQSISAVPAGLTRHREELFPLSCFEKDDCLKTIGQIEAFSHRCREKHGVGLAYAADEFYIAAGLDLPPYEHYDDFCQLENGVGLMRVFYDEFMSAADDCDKCTAKRKFSIATGVLTQPHLKRLVCAAKDKINNLCCDIYAIENVFFGSSITVSGLVTGGDIAEQLKGVDLGDALLIPRSMLCHDGVTFLDDYTTEKLSQSLGVPIHVIFDGHELFNVLKN